MEGQGTHRYCLVVLKLDVVSLCRPFLFPELRVGGLLFLTLNLYSVVFFFFYMQSKQWELPKLLSATVNYHSTQEHNTCLPASFRRS